MLSRQIICFAILVSLFGSQTAQAGLVITRSTGISLTGADGVRYVEPTGLSLTGADSFLKYQPNGISLTGADGISLTGADGISLTGADGSTYTGVNGISLTGADGISLTGADGISLTGADGISLTGADGTTYHANSFFITNPTGISLTGADGISLTGADGISLTGADGISLTGADGISLTGADGISLTGADSVTGFDDGGNPIRITATNGTISLTGADGISLTGADGVTITVASGISLTGASHLVGQHTGAASGLQSLDPALAVQLNQATDDSNVNAVIVFHQYPTSQDFANLQNAGISTGTKFRKLPFVIVTARRAQLIEVSRLTSVRSIYGVRTLNLNADPYLKATQTERVYPDRDLQSHNLSLPVTGRNVTVAVLDTGVNSQHNDLNGRVVQNVRLTDLQSAAIGFSFPLPVENLANTDPVAGHGSFVAGIIAASGISSGGKFAGVAPGARIMGLSAGDLNLTHVLSGFDYLLDKGATYNARVVNCSFSANTVFDWHDPVNIATKMLTENGINVVFSAGNSGAGNSTLNPYAAAPWVISVGATDEKSRLAGFSSRGTFGSPQFAPSLVAPGVNIAGLRSLPTQTSIIGVGAGADSVRLTPAEIPFYTTASGTSFSAPQVAGAVAMMLEANPNLTPAQIKDILQRTATPLPPYFAHEVGAGMLNSYAAVLEAAFPARRMGDFRAILNHGRLRFVTESPTFISGTATPGAPSQFAVNFGANIIQSTVHLAWGGMLTTNDLALNVRDENGVLRGESNYLNAAELGGRRERITFHAPPAASWRATVGHTLGVGTIQNYTAAIESTRVEYEDLEDVNTLPAAQQQSVQSSLQNFSMLPEGSQFNPQKAVSRRDLATALVRGGRIPQYLAGNPMFSDVQDLNTRNAVESVQKSPFGVLFYDASTNGAFLPYEKTSRLIAAVALVKAAGLQSSAQSAMLTGVSDAGQIPAAYRGYVAVALQKGLLAKEANNFSPGKALTRAELAAAMVRLNRIFTE